MPATLDLSEAAAAAAGENQESLNQNPVASAPDEAGVGTQGASVDTPAATPASTEPWSLRSELKNLGLDPAQFNDDKAAWGHLSQTLAQREQEYRLARQYQDYFLANQQQIEAALRAQQEATKAAAAPKEPAKSWWTAPEWNDEWLRYLTKDANGNVVAIQGANPQLALKYQEYQNWQREKFNSFLRDPISTIKPGLEETFKPMIEEAIKQHLGQYGDRQYAQNYVQTQAAQWAFQKDAQGNVLRDQFTGQPQLTPAGQRFAQYVQYAEQMGIRDVRGQQTYAEAMLQKDALQAFYQQHQGQQNGGQPPATAAQNPNDVNDAQKRKALASGQRRMPAAGGGNGAPTPKGRGNTDIRMTLGQRLKAAFKEAGVNELT